MNAASLPSSVLVKIATLEGACVGLTDQLEQSRKGLQRLRIELRDLTPREVYDPEGANAESDRLYAEGERLSKAITAQIEICERQEKRLRAEEAVVRSCKQYLHELPDDAQLRVVESKSKADLDTIRSNIRSTREEIAAVLHSPVPSSDLPDRIKAYVAGLRSVPTISGISAGQNLTVHWPLRPDANPITQSGYSDFEVNALLMAAFLDADRLVERLLEAALTGSITQTERDRRLHGLNGRLNTLRYDEEQAICAALAKGADVTRDAEAWAVLMVSVEHEQRAAA